MSLKSIFHLIVANIDTDIFSTPSIFKLVVAKINIDFLDPVAHLPTKKCEVLYVLFDLNFFAFKLGGFLVMLICVNVYQIY